MEKILRELSENGYDFALAVATEAEMQANAACGQLAIIIENQ
jgi:adenine C2-methylase RlmN of 23S rRNA A2503 and tRNA A37